MLTNTNTNNYFDTLHLCSVDTPPLPHTAVEIWVVENIRFSILVMIMEIKGLQGRKLVMRTKPNDIKALGKYDTNWGESVTLTRSQFSCL